MNLVEFQNLCDSKKNLDTSKGKISAERLGKYATKRDKNVY